MLRVSENVSYKRDLVGAAHTDKTYLQLPMLFSPSLAPSPTTYPADSSVGSPPSDGIKSTSPDDSLGSEGDRSQDGKKSYNSTTRCLSDVEADSTFRSPSPQLMTLSAKMDDVTAAGANQKRTVFSRKQVAALEARFVQQSFLCREERIELAEKLSITERQVMIWFQNRRGRLKKRGTADSAYNPSKFKELSGNRRPYPFLYGMLSSMHYQTSSNHQQLWSLYPDHLRQAASTALQSSPPGGEGAKAGLPPVPAHQTPAANTPAAPIPAARTPGPAPAAHTPASCSLNPHSPAAYNPASCDLINSHIADQAAPPNVVINTRDSRPYESCRVTQQQRHHPYARRNTAYNSQDPHHSATYSSLGMTGAYNTSLPLLTTSAAPMTSPSPAMTSATTPMMSSANSYSPPEYKPFYSHPASGTALDTTYMDQQYWGGYQATHAPQHASPPFASWPQNLAYPSSAAAQPLSHPGEYAHPGASASSSPPYQYSVACRFSQSPSWGQSSAQSLAQNCTPLTHSKNYSP